MSDFLSQEEIDALLKSNGEEGNSGETPEKQPISEIEQDALGEIGNISMGSAATALSQLLNQRVNITTPKVRITTAEELLSSFQVPFMLIEVSFTEGLQGSNLLVIKVSDAAIIADLMMGGDGTNPASELNELHISAVGEAMNQMIGSAATSMSTIFQKPVAISPPRVTSVGQDKDEINFPWDLQEKIVAVSFKMEIGALVNSEIMQIMPIPVAKEKTSMLLGTAQPEAPSQEITATGDTPEVKDEDVESTDVLSQEEIEKLLAGVSQEEESSSHSGTSSPPQEPATFANGEMPRNIDLILDVPLNISVVLGRTKKPIKEVLNLIPGSIVELEKLAEEPVEILVNGTLIAHGEVVVINENFGVRILAIDSPTQRLNNLRK